jgi:hypothetical protein
MHKAQYVSLRLALRPSADFPSQRVSSNNIEQIRPSKTCVTLTAQCPTAGVAVEDQIRLHYSVFIGRQWCLFWSLEWWLAVAMAHTARLGGVHFLFFFEQLESTHYLQ